MTWWVFLLNNDDVCERVTLVIFRPVAKIFAKITVEYLKY